MRGLVFIFGLFSAIALADVSEVSDVSDVKALSGQADLTLLVTPKQSVPDASQQTRVKESQKDQAPVFQLVMPPKLNLGLCDGSD